MDPVALGHPDHAVRADHDRDGLITIELPFDIVRRDNGARILATSGSMPIADSSTGALVRAVARGYAWRRKLLNGSASSIADIAKTEGISHRYVARLVRLGFLAPDHRSHSLKSTACPINGRSAARPYPLRLGRAAPTVRI
jgi:hypothetical protein